MNAALFLIFVTAALSFGCWLGRRLAHASRQIDTILDSHRSDCAINDAADMATDAEEREKGADS